MTEFHGLIIASGCLWLTAMMGGVFEWFNRRVVAAGTMACVLVGFTAVVFVHHLPHDQEHGRYVAHYHGGQYHDCQCEDVRTAILEGAKLRWYATREAAESDLVDGRQLVPHSCIIESRFVSHLPSE